MTTPQEASRDPDAAPHAAFDVGLRHTCGDCGGLAAMTDKAVLTGTRLIMVTWYTEHRPGCPGAVCPERSYLLDVDALRAGDGHLPGLDHDAQDGAVAIRPAPAGASRPLGAPAPGRAGPRRCWAVASTTGQQCKLPAGPDGMCGVHRTRR